MTTAQLLLIWLRAAAALRSIILVNVLRLWRFGDSEKVVLDQYCVCLLRLTFRSFEIHSASLFPFL